MLFDFERQNRLTCQGTKSFVDVTYLTKMLRRCHVFDEKFCVTGNAQSLLTDSKKKLIKLLFDMNENHSVHF